MRVSLLAEIVVLTLMYIGLLIIGYWPGSAS